MHRGDWNWLLVTDLDDTLLGDDAAFSRFVRTTTSVGGLAVAINSSRPLHSIRSTLSEVAVAWQPVAIVGALGTEIELEGRRIPEWSDRFGNFDRAPIDSLMSRLGHPPHAPEYQTPLKASFTVPAAVQDEAADAVAALGMETMIIRSGSSNFDVIPTGAGKGSAAQWLATRLEIPPGNVIAAGDSRNDVDMLLSARGIAVGNASPELKQLLAGSGAYFASAAHANGVVEGLRHHGVPVEIGNSR